MDELNEFTQKLSETPQLAGRVISLLRKNGVSTIDDFMKKPIKDLLNMAPKGTKTHRIIAFMIDLKFKNFKYEKNKSE